MTIYFSVRAWQAWMPGIATAKQWQAWADELSAAAFNTAAINTEYEKTKIHYVPAMLRRRLNRLGNIALRNVDSLLQETIADNNNREELPCVFISQHGDMAKTNELLAAIANKESLSPMQFSLSVHNAIGGIHSIAQQNQAAMSAIASSHGQFAPGLLEALLLMQETASEAVLLVAYDEPLTGFYDGLCDTPQLPYSLATLLTMQEKTTADFSLELVDNPQFCPSEKNWPEAVQFIRFILSGHSQLALINNSSSTWLINKLSSDH